MYDVFLSILNFLAKNLAGNYGLAIVSLTLLIRLLLLPLLLPSLKSHKKIQSLKPELDKLKKQFGDNKQVLSQKQMELYKQHNVNPLAGCLPQILQLILFFAFYQVLITSLKDSNTPYSLQFLWFNLSQPDKTFVLPVLTSLSQLVLGLMLLPATDTQAEKKLAKISKDPKDSHQALDMDQMAQTMQSQMIFMMPIMTGFLALRFPSGLALYWVTSTAFSVFQQYFVSGWGGLAKYFAKIYSAINKQ